MPHGHHQGWAPAEIGLYVDQHLRGGQPLPLIATPMVGDGKVTADVQSSLPLKSAALHYTTDQGEYPKRRWKSQPLELDGKHAAGLAPPREARIWFVTVTDDRGATTSSELMFAMQHELEAEVNHENTKR
jgi:hypothetical protein